MDNVRHECNNLGYPGAVGSADATHVRWACAPRSLQRRYTGKGDFATIVYQATVTYSRYAIGITEGFRGAQSDKTVFRHDITVQTVKESKWYRDMESEAAAVAANRSSRSDQPDWPPHAPLGQTGGGKKPGRWR